MLHTRANCCLSGYIIHNQLNFALIISFAVIDINIIMINGWNPSSYQLIKIVLVGLAENEMISRTSDYKLRTNIKSCWGECMMHMFKRISSVQNRFTAKLTDFTYWQGTTPCIIKNLKTLRNTRLPKLCLVHLRYFVMHVIEIKRS